MVRQAAAMYQRECALGKIYGKRDSMKIVLWLLQTKSLEDICGRHFCSVDVMF